MVGVFIQACTNHYTLCIVMLGVMLLGVTCGLLGTLMFLRGNSLFADAISHAALPGVVAAFLLLHTKNSTLLMLGGVISSGIATLFLSFVRRYSRLKMDTLLGMILSIFFGFGLVLMTVAQKLPLPHQAVLNKYIFGMAATLMPYDIYVIASISFSIIIIVVSAWKEISLVLFDPIFAHTVGYNLALYDCMLLLLLILLIAVGLQTVGVILMSALLIAPAVAARQWTQRITSMAWCASIFGAFASLLGTYISYCVHNLPTGPVIVIIITAIACVSFCITPSRIA